MNYIDAGVARRLRQIRLERGLNPEGLAEAIGVPLERFHSWELGEVRVGSAHLVALSRALSVRVATFFEDGPPSAPQ